MSWSTVDDLEDWTQITLVQIGRAVRELRRAQRLTQQRLADRSGLSQSSISRLENGVAPGLRIAWLARILVGVQDGIDDAGHWRPQYTSAHRERLFADFGPRGWLNEQIQESEVARQAALADLLEARRMHE